MAELVANCPRCGASKVTFDVKGEQFVRQEYGWQYWFETFCICRHCNGSTTFVLAQNTGSDSSYVHNNGVLGIKGSVNHFMRIEEYVSIKDHVKAKPPEFLPKNIEAIFKEGSVCLASQCYNAAGTMFRLCVDLSTSSLLPSEDEEGLTNKVRRDLGLRLPWLFSKGRLPEALKELSVCIKDDGNDGAHRGTLTKPDVEDLLDFTFALLERLYTEPERLKVAKERREKRRSGN